MYHVLHAPQNIVLSKMVSVSINEKELSDEDGEKDEPRSGESLYDFAMKNPESEEHSFLAMTTPEMLKVIHLERVMIMMMRDSVGRELSSKANLEYSHKVKPIEEDTKVMNVALLSARIEEIFPPSVQTDQMERKDDGPDAPLQDDSLIPPEDDNGVQVVAQLEVLYELQQSSINEDGKVHTKTYVMVGKFEACIDGDPTVDEIRWRIAHDRPAFEFSHYSTSW